MYENGPCWVGRTRDSYTVFRSGVTHSTSDSAYKKTPDGLSIAIARCKYLAKQKAKGLGGARRRRRARRR